MSGNLTNTRMGFVNQHLAQIMFETIMKKMGEHSVGQDKSLGDPEGDDLFVIYMKLRKNAQLMAAGEEPLYWMPGDLSENDKLAIAYIFTVIFPDDSTLYEVDLSNPAAPVCYAQIDGERKSFEEIYDEILED